MLVVVDFVACLILYATVPLKTQLSLLQCEPTLILTVNSRLLFVTRLNNDLSNDPKDGNRVSSFNHSNYLTANNPTLVSVRIPRQLLDKGCYSRRLCGRNKANSNITSQASYVLTKAAAAAVSATATGSLSMTPSPLLPFKGLPVVRAIPMMLSKYQNTSVLRSHAWVWITGHLDETPLGTNYELIDLDLISENNTVPYRANSQYPLFRKQGCRQVSDFGRKPLHDGLEGPFSTSSLSIVACNSRNHPSSGVPSLRYNLAGINTLTCPNGPSRQVTGARKVLKVTQPLNVPRLCPTLSQVIIIPDTGSTPNYVSLIQKRSRDFEPPGDLDMAYGVLLVQPHGVKFVYAHDIVTNVTVCYRELNTSQPAESTMSYLFPTSNTTLFHKRLVVSEFFHFDSDRSRNVSGSHKRDSSQVISGGPNVVADHISYTLSSAFLVAMDIVVRCKVSDLKLWWQDDHDRVIVFRDNLASHRGCLLIPVHR